MKKKTKNQILEERIDRLEQTQSTIVQTIGRSLEQQFPVLVSIESLGEILIAKGIIGRQEIESIKARVSEDMQEKIRKASKPPEPPPEPTEAPTEGQEATDGT